MDVSKMTPAPWRASPEGWAIKAVLHGNDVLMSTDFQTHAPAIRDDFEFVALARNDLDVRLRRGWHTERLGDLWFVPQLTEHLYYGRQETLTEAMYQKGHDVGLLTKADEWYRTNIETGLPK